MNIIILILGVLAAFGPLSIDMYLPTLPRIAEDFKVPLAEVQLSLASYFVGLALGQIFYGPITDRIGRKKPLYFGLALYAIASFACASTMNANGLIFYRFIQALGACAGTVISRAIVRDKFHAQDSARVFSLLMLIMGVAPILAPIMGGYLAEYWGWRSIFWILTALSTLALIGVGIFLPETHKFDKKVEFSETFATFNRIMKDREFMGFTLSGALAQAGLFAYITGSPFVLMKLFGLSTDQYSIVFGSNAFGLILFSQINARLLKRFSPHKILHRIYPLIAFFGVLLFTAGYFELGLVPLCLFLFLFIATLGMTFPNSTACALAHQGEFAGSASALMGTLQFTVSAIFSALVSHFHNGTMKPMTFIMGFCGFGALLLYRFIVPRRN